jgi:XapX domain-containing protein
VKPYLIALSAGLLVGIVYSLLQVRSPAPPMVALVGLLGILLGEQALPVAKRLLSGRPLTSAWLQHECAPHVLGGLPAGTNTRLSCSDPGGPAGEARRDT